MNTKNYVILALALNFLAYINSYSMNRGGSALKNNLSKAFKDLNLTINKPFALSQNDLKCLRRQFLTAYHPDKYNRDPFYQEQARIKLNKILEDLSMLEAHYSFKNSDMHIKDRENLIRLIQAAHNQWEQNLEEEKEFAEFKEEEERHAQEQQERLRQRALKRALVKKRVLCALGAVSACAFMYYHYQQELLDKAISDMQKLLHNAVDNNDTSDIYIALLGLGSLADINYKNKDENSIFHIACQNKDMGLIEYLIDNYPELKTYQLNKENKSALEYLAQSVDFITFKKVLDRLSLPNMQIPECSQRSEFPKKYQIYLDQGWMKAVLDKTFIETCQSKTGYHKHREALKFFASKGLYQSLVYRSYNLLDLAIKHNDYELMIFLMTNLKARPTVSIPEYVKDSTALALLDSVLNISLNRRYYDVKNAIKFKNVNYTKEYFDTDDRCAGLYKLCEYGDSSPESLEILLNLYDPLHKDRIEKKEVLEKEIKSNSKNLVAKILLELKDKDLSEEQIRTLWSRYKREEVIQETLQAGDFSKVLPFFNAENITQEDGEFIARRKFHSALHLAVAQEKKDLITVLLKHGCSINQRNEQGQTPLFYARSKEMAEWLIKEHNADIMLKDNQGRSAIFKWYQSPEDNLELYKYYLSLDKKLEIVKPDIKDNNLWHILAESCSNVQEKHKQVLFDKADLLYSYDATGVKSKDFSGKTPGDRAHDNYINFRNPLCKDLSQYYKKLLQ